MSTVRFPNTEGLVNEVELVFVGFLKVALFSNYKSTTYADKLLIKSSSKFNFLSLILTNMGTNNSLIATYSPFKNCSLFSHNLILM